MSSSIPSGTGTLLPVFSLPNNHGIGTLGQEAYAFIDWLAATNQCVWQMLPLEMPGYGNSPYQCLSPFAKNTLLIDVEAFPKEVKAERKHYPLTTKVDYDLLNERAELLDTIADTIYEDIGTRNAVEKFTEENKWVTTWAEFYSLKVANALKPWWEWTVFESTACARNRQKTLQYVFDLQWKKLKTYAQDKGVKIMGDIPFYIAKDSDCVWENPEWFSTDVKGVSSAVAGVPPDYFSKTGQYWGNPVYSWSSHKLEVLTWWKSRLDNALATYDIVRIDHFRAFADYWSIPGGAASAAEGQWIEGVGFDVFKLYENWQELPFVVEDLGERTELLKTLMKDCPYPAMGILQFGFDSSEGSAFKPSDMIENTVYYTGTHDNATIVSWYAEASVKDRVILQTVLQKADLEHTDFIDLALTSKSKLKIFPMQDRLGLTSLARLNTPGLLSEENWRWRCPENYRDVLGK